jgi:hypothetical protein
MSIVLDIAKQCQGLRGNAMGVRRSLPPLLRFAKQSGGGGVLAIKYLQQRKNYTFQHGLVRLPLPQLKNNTVAACRASRRQSLRSSAGKNFVLRIISGRNPEPVEGFRVGAKILATQAFLKPRLRVPLAKLLAH